MAAALEYVMDAGTVVQPVQPVRTHFVDERRLQRQS